VLTGIWSYPSGTPHFYFHVLVESAGIPENINLALQLRSAPEPKHVS
jgi:hypothetical protein